MAIAIDRVRSNKIGSRWLARDSMLKGRVRASLNAERGRKKDNDGSRLPLGNRNPKSNVQCPKEAAKAGLKV